MIDGEMVAEGNQPLDGVAGIVLRFFSGIVRVLVGLTMLAIAAWLVSGVWVVTADAYHAAPGDWGEHSEQAIIRLLTMLALLELWRTLQSYLEIGRVRVTFIVDAALVVLVGELIGLWYREHTVGEVLLSLGVIFALAMLRIVTMHYSPEKQSPEGQE